ncbi:MAG: class I SAM-dependent methyltransferase [Planctomycetota bacterium]|nr:class I SAM-dependent methyltransferase [Planctomycetota bacterium]
MNPDRIGPSNRRLAGDTPVEYHQYAAAERATAGGPAVETPGAGAVNAGGKTAGEVRRMFAAIARRYDIANAILSFGLDSSWRRRAAREAAGLPAGLVVDVCTGTGALAFEIARFAAAEANSRHRSAPEDGRAAEPGRNDSSGRKDAPLAVGVDFCPDMLRVATQRGGAGRTGGGSPARGAVAFVLADAIRLPLADASAAAAFIAFGLRNVPDTEGCLREMARIVAPGGKVVVLEFAMPERRLFGFVYSFYLRLVLPVAGRLISGAGNDAYGYLARSVAGFRGPEEIAAMMARAGLKDIHAEPLTGGTVWLYRGRKG